MSKGAIIKARNAWNLFLIIQIIVTLAALAQGELTLTIALIVYMICTAIQQSDLAGRMIFGLKAYVCDDPANAIQIDANNPITHRKIIFRYCLDLVFWGILALLAIQLSPEPLLTAILCLIQGKLVVDQLSEKPRKAVVITSHCNPVAIILIQISSNYPYHALLGTTAIILMLYEGIIIAKTDESIQADTGNPRTKNKSEKKSKKSL